MKLIASLFALLFLASCASTSILSPEQRFNKADKDGTGSIERSEATHLMIAEAFAMYDDNGDGVITEAEYTNNGGTAKEFRELNKSGSGEVTLEEAQASPAVFSTFVEGFDEADANKNGKVTLAEYLSYLELRDAAVR